MKHVQIEVHKGIAVPLAIDPDVEVEIVDVDAKEVVVYDFHGDAIEARTLNDEEIKNHE